MTPIPLRQEQVDAACRLHQTLQQWQRSDAALIRLRDALPGFDAETCLLKAVAVNTLYGTQVLAIVRMGEHVCQTLKRTDLSVGPELVETIADLPKKEGDQSRRFVSFAAKFCHFFVDEKRFPIYDEAARDTLVLHLGKNRTDDEKHPYRTFCENLKRLRDVSRISADGRELD